MVITIENFDDHYSLIILFKRFELYFQRYDFHFSEAKSGETAANRNKL